MGWIATILIAAGFLMATYVAALSVTDVAWAAFAPAIFVGILGVVMLKRIRRAEATAGHVLRGSRETLAASLAQILERLEELEAAKDRVDTEDLRHEIDRRFRSDLIAFADARQALAHLYGLRAYAEIMSSFAAGERYLNRVWSASTDGYGEEARAYIAKALDQFRHAQARLSEIAAAGTKER